MVCPTCGLTNPPNSQACDCGYDFQRLVPSASPGWPISLRWSQTLAAFWSISWPALMWSFLIMGLLASLSDLSNHFFPIAVLGQLSFFSIQAVLTRRLVRKSYRSFCVYAVRGDGNRNRSLSMSEAVRIWFWLLSPQLALVLVQLISWRYSAKLPDEALRLISSFGLWLRFLCVGPYGVHLALKAKYPGFRLQAYGYKV